MFNIISLIGGILSLALSKFLIKAKHGQVYIRIISFIIFAYKAGWYIYENIRFGLSIPVEISSISYFIVSIIMFFKLYRFYNVAAFFGFTAGLGYFAFYIGAGFILEKSITIFSLITAILYHGYLLVVGIYLIHKYKFNSKKSYSLWIVMFAIISWALLFYDKSGQGITFISYVIRPTYLEFFTIPHLNFLVLAIFYTLLCLAFYFWIKLFYILNEKSFYRQEIGARIRI